METSPGKDAKSDVAPTVIKYRLAGEVQRVGFRHFLKMKARELNLGGYAANEPDGSLVVLLSGDREDIGKLSPLLYEGPSGARVAAMTEIVPDDDDIPPDDEFSVR